MELEKADPFASVDASRNGEILEGDLNAEHGYVFENYQIDERQKGKYIHLPMAAKADCQSFVFHETIISNSRVRNSIIIFYVVICSDSMTNNWNLRLIVK